MSSQEDRNLDHETLEVVAERTTEVAGQVVVDVLTDAGIKAVAVGWHTASFRAESPGTVQIKTFAKDARRAREVISEIQPSENVQ